MEDRKKDHINLAFQSQTLEIENDNRFVYEPMLGTPSKGEMPEFTFLNKQLKSPLWASSMTGGTALAKTINENIARVCHDFGMGMGLGSCRIILEDNEYFEDFNVRQYIGENLPLYANLGIAQVELLLKQKKTSVIVKLIEKLRADGLIIHVNPLQEWFQPEGNLYLQAPVDTIEQLLELVSFPIIVKEVGQGIGKESLRKLLQFPLQAIEFGAYGGTNFSLVEMYRNHPEMLEVYKPVAFAGQTAKNMVNDINSLQKSIDIKCKELIVSGGIKNFLDGYYLTELSEMPAIYGQASTILKYAKESYESLYNFVDAQMKGFSLAKEFFRINNEA